jgi:hypothetical protein
VYKKKTQNKTMRKASHSIEGSYNMVTVFIRGKRNQKAVELCTQGAEKQKEKMTSQGRMNFLVRQPFETVANKDITRNGKTGNLSELPFKRC